MAAEVKTAQSRADIFDGGDDTQYDTVLTPEWPKCGAVRVRSLTAEERSNYESAMWRTDKDGKPVRNKEAVRLSRGKLCALAIVDDKGARLFTDDDAGELSRKNAAAVDRIATAVAKLSGMAPESVEEEEGN